MEKLRLLLFGVFIAAVFGGAIASKAEKIHRIKDWCTAASSGQCTSYTTNSVITTGDHELLWATETVNTNGCSGLNAPVCNQQLRLTSTVF